MNVFDLVAKISLDTSEYERGLNSVKSGISSFGSKIKSGFGTVAKVGAVAVGAATTAVGAITKIAMSGYAEQEQLVGGVQKLYGNMGMSLKEYAAYTGKSVDEVRGEWRKLEKAQNLVLNNAKNAYKTAGMSMNEYMDTATSFSAALINALEGDSIEAAKRTDVAMRAISDNFNTFGGDIGMIRGAFQGFAKQNYTMLDNLKLGYGGTKTEMERLIADANEYAKSIGKASDLSIDSFADVVTAIDLIQQKQGVAGTTAREAATTIAGSLGMLKSAWSNLMAGLADSEADIDTLVDNVVSSAETAFTNLLPTIENTFSGITKSMEKLAPIIAQKFPDLAKKVLPSLISAAASLIAGLVKAVPALIITIIDQIPMVITTLTGAIKDTAPMLIEAGKNLLDTVSGELLKAAQTMTGKAGTIVDSIIKAVSAKFPAVGALISQIVDIVKAGVENIRAFWSTNGEMILTTARDIWGRVSSAIHTAIEGIATVISTILNEIQHLWELYGQQIVDIVSAFVELLKAIFERVKQVVGIVLAAILSLWNTYGGQIMDAATRVWTFISNVITQALNIIKKVIKTVTAVIKGDWSTALEGVKSITTSVFELIKYVISNALNAIKAVVSTAWGVIKSIVSIALEAIRTKVESIWESIKTTIKTKIDSAKNAVNTAIEAIKGFFASIVPSTVTSKFTEIKKGISDAINGAKEAVSSAIETIKGVLNTTLSFPKIKIPHFSITGGTAPWGIGGAGSPPVIDIQWYAKAMKDAYLLSGASIFGSMGGKFLGGGEAGREILIGEQKALSMISEASGGGAIIALLNEILLYLRTTMPYVLRDILENGLSFEIDGREFGRAVRTYAE